MVGAALLVLIRTARFVTLLKTALNAFMDITWMRTALARLIVLIVTVKFGMMKRVNAQFAKTDTVLSRAILFTPLIVWMLTPKSSSGRMLGFTNSVWLKTLVMEFAFIIGMVSLQCLMGSHLALGQSLVMVMVFWMVLFLRTTNGLLRVPSSGVAEYLTVKVLCFSCKLILLEMEVLCLATVLAQVLVII